VADDAALRSSQQEGDPPTRTDLDLVYVTENVISMAFPCDPARPTSIPESNNLNLVSEHFHQKHSGHFMIWNVSEEPYDYSKFEDQVLEYKFPGHPSPPLGLLFKICTSIENWLDADERNVAVVHCLTGRGRTAALIACVLAWIGEFSTPMEALNYVAQMRNVSTNYLVIPSQRRYVQYFSNMLDGVRPRPEPLVLKKIIFNTIPVFGDNGAGEANSGCCPYIQLFKCGKLIATASPIDNSNSNSGSSTNSTSNTEGDEGTFNSNNVRLKWVTVVEETISFSLDFLLQGDILMRCRHIDANGSRTSMFRAAFHTGYVPTGAYRLERSQLDGANVDFRFSEDFFIDLIFEPAGAHNNVDPANAATSSSTVSSNSNAVDPGNADVNTDSSNNSSSSLTTIVDKYENSLHRDTRFWDAVAFRKSKCKKRKSRRFQPTAETQFSISDDFISNIVSNVLVLGKGDHQPTTSDPSEFDKNLHLTDEELILQSQTSGSASSPIAGQTNSLDAEEEMEAFIRNLTGSGALGVTGSIVEPDKGGKPESPPSSSGTGSSKGELLSGNDELAALEQLERELGL
jgi:protein-tyrosine phosphatase